MAETVNPILLDLPEQLVGERVLVRPYRPGDGGALWEAVEESREHILPWLPWGDTHKTRADSEAFCGGKFVQGLIDADVEPVVICCHTRTASSSRRRAAPNP